MTSLVNREQKLGSPSTGPPASNTRLASSQRASQTVHNSPAPSQPVESNLQTLTPQQTPVQNQSTHFHPSFLPMNQPNMSMSHFQLPNFYHQQQQLTDLHNRNIIVEQRITNLDHKIDASFDALDAKLNKIVAAVPQCNII